MSRKLRDLAVLLILLTLSACVEEESSALKEQPVTKQEEAVLVVKNVVKQAEVEHQWQQVSVVFNDFEGGFYGLVTAKNEKLLPLNLPKKYRVPGTLMKIKGKYIKDMMTTVQWGEVFEISEHELILLGTVKKNNGIVE